MPKYGISVFKKLYSVSKWYCGIPKKSVYCPTLILRSYPNCIA